LPPVRSKVPHQTAPTDSANTSLVQHSATTAGHRRTRPAATYSRARLSLTPRARRTLPTIPQSSISFPPMSTSWASRVGPRLCFAIVRLARAFS
jgi:hypothetical protein